MGLIFDNFLAEMVDLVSTSGTYIGIGTGPVPLVDSDTLLDNETARKAATVTEDGNTVIFEAYWDESEGNGATYTETGVFWDGAGVAVDSGALLSGGQIDVIKDSTQTLTVSVEVTIEAVNT